MFLPHESSASSCPFGGEGGCCGSLQTSCLHLPGVRLVSRGQRISWASGPWLDHGRGCAFYLGGGPQG